MVTSNRRQSPGVGPRISDLSGHARITSDRRARASGDDSDRHLIPRPRIGCEGKREAQDSAKASNSKGSPFCSAGCDDGRPISASDFFFGTRMPPQRDPGVEAPTSEMRPLIPALAEAAFQDRLCRSGNREDRVAKPHSQFPYLAPSLARLTACPQSGILQSRFPCVPFETRRLDVLNLPLLQSGPRFQRHRGHLPARASSWCASVRLCSRRSLHGATARDSSAGRAHPRPKAASGGGAA